jgi:sporulation protein YlmC with PRC-barrel domain
MSRKFLTATALSCLMLSAAFAQSPSTPNATQAANENTSSITSTTSTKPDFIQAQKPDQWLGSKFKGTDVMGPDNQKVGDISDLLLDKSGQIQAYIVSVGGFLGVGSKEVALAPKSFQVVPNGANPNDVKLKISMTKDELKQAPDFQKYSPPTTTSSNMPMTRPTAPGGLAPAPAPSKQ